MKILCATLCFFMACYCCLAEVPARGMLSPEPKTPVFRSHWLCTGKPVSLDGILPVKSPGPLSLTGRIYEPIMADRPSGLVNFRSDSPFGDKKATRIIVRGVIGAILGAGGFALAYNLNEASQEGPAYTTSSHEQQKWVLSGAVIGAIMGIYIASTSD